MLTPRRASSTASPVRTCAGCGRRAPQAELVRFHAVGETLRAGPGAGRGVYTCRRLVCFERARASRGFSRSLRRSVTVGDGLARLYTSGDARR